MKITFEYLRAIHVLGDLSHDLSYKHDFERYILESLSFVSPFIQTYIYLSSYEHNIYVYYFGRNI